MGATTKAPLQICFLDELLKEFMGVPKRKTSKMRLRTRKASHRTQPLKLRVDQQTGLRHRSHCVDPETGMYRGRQVIDITAEA